MNPVLNRCMMPLNFLSPSDRGARYCPSNNPLTKIEWLVQQHALSEIRTTTYRTEKSKK